jgi:hypothetical protein
MSIPSGDTPSILFHRTVQNKQPKINNSYHETTMDDRTAKLDEPCINKANHTKGSNHDLSYYFHNSSSTNTASSGDEQFPNGLCRRGRSLSIGSTLSISPNSQQQPLRPSQTPPPPSTPHQQQFIIVSAESKAQFYKNKADKFRKKAYQFFGEQAKLEISAKEIKREGLKALLHSSVPLGYFLYHLLNEYSSENLV